MRLFVAIELSDEVRKALSQTQAALKRDCPDVRWIPPEQLHLTVKFLGEVADGDVNEACKAMERAAEQSKPFTMRTGDCGCFPERGPVRIVWTRCVEDRDLLAGCVAAVEAQFEPLGFPPERRPFAAHITIGRVRDDRSQDSLRSKVAAARGNSMEQEVSLLMMMSSTLSPRGSIYTGVSRANLCGI